MKTITILEENEYGKTYRREDNYQIHRDDGPAVENYDGNKAWYKNGKLHRLNGPAIENKNGFKEWWVEGVKQSPPAPKGD